jgi:hypothetical protein
VVFPAIIMGRLTALSSPPAQVLCPLPGHDQEACLQDRLPRGSEHSSVPSEPSAEEALRSQFFYTSVKIQNSVLRDLS